MDDLLPGFDSHVAQRSNYNSENDVEKENNSKDKERYYSGQYVNWTELAQSNDTHEVPCVFFYLSFGHSIIKGSSSFKINLLLYSFLKDAISLN